MRELDRWFDDATAELQIGPERARRMQPAEVMEYMRGRRRVWSRQCVLTAWQTWLIASCSVFGANLGSFDQFLKKYPPPGYDPEA